jgi:hypothetical protein
MSVFDRDAMTGSLWASIKFNLSVLPDSLVTGLTVLSIVLANYTLMILAAGIIITQLFTGYVGGIVAPSSMKSPCESEFYAVTVNRLFGVDPPSSGPLAPSSYMASIAYLFGVGVALQQIYAVEIEKFKTGSPLVATAIIGLMLVLLTALFRLSTRCDTVTGALGGTVLGFAIGYFGCVLLGYATNRRATNVWGIPFLMDRINKGSAIYVPVE